MWWVLVAAAAILIGFACWPIFLGKGYIYGDLAMFTLPSRIYIQQQMQHGILPLWQPSVFGGFYLHGEGQSAILHPYHLLSVTLLNPLLQIQLEAMGAFVFMLSGCFFLFRRWGVSRSAALLGGLTFAFSGFSRIHLPHSNAMDVLAHMPWMLLSIDHLYRDPAKRGRWSLALAALNASAILTGYPPFYFFTVLFQVWYVLWFFGESHWWKRTLQWAAALIGGVLMGAPQWLPTLTAGAGSIRDKPSAEFLLYGSFHPLNLLSFANPLLFRRGVMGADYPDEMNIYPGVGVLFLALYFVLSPELRSRHRRAYRMLAALAVFGAVLGFGQYAKVYSWFWIHLPVVGSFRVPVRYFCMFQFALAGVCALAYDPFLNVSYQLSTRRRQYLAAVVLGAGALAALGFGIVKSKVHGYEMPLLPVLGRLRSDYFSDWRLIVLGSVLVLLLCACYILAVRHQESGRRR